MNTAQRIASLAKRSPGTWADGIELSHQEQHEANTHRIVALVRLAFEKLRHGTQDSHQYMRLRAAFGDGLARAAAMDEFEEVTMQAGIEALERCADIFIRHQRYGFHGPDLAVVNQAVDLYEGILRISGSANV